MYKGLTAKIKTREPSFIRLVEKDSGSTLLGQRGSFSLEAIHSDSGYDWRLIPVRCPRPRPWPFMRDDGMPHRYG